MVGLKIRLLKLGLKAIEPFQDRLNKINLFKRTFQVFYDKFVPDEWILVEVEGIKMYLNPKDRAISRFVLQKGGYEIGTTRVFKNIVKEGMIVFDIGAHWGYYSLIAASLGAKVFAFEPHPFNYKLLIKTISENGLNNIVPLNKAVSSKTGKEKLFCSTLNFGGHSLVRSENEGNTVDVETITLDEFCENNQVFPDIVKMDIEGAEILALRGMKRTIERSDNLKMFIEFEYNREELYDFLSKYFDIYRITKDGQLIPFDKTDENCKRKYCFEPNIYCEKCRF